jgi:prepilin-type N-terminal cleavage/methylation domain-containing protein
MRARPVRSAGFTLIELTVAITVLATVVAFVYQILQNSVRGQDLVRVGLKAPKVQNALLSQILRDFRYLYWTDFTGGAGFLGQSRTVASRDGDRVDFVTARRTRIARPDEGEASHDIGASPLAEVGYACRANEQHGEWITLWRREDFFVDDDPTAGGVYTMVYDRIRTFSLDYFPNPREHREAERTDEWNSAIRKQLPYAVIVRIEFDVEDPPARGEPPREPHKITRIVLLRGGADDAVDWGAAPPAN